MLDIRVHSNDSLFWKWEKLCKSCLDYQFLFFFLRVFFNVSYVYMCVCYVDQKSIFFFFSYHTYIYFLFNFGSSSCLYIYDLLTQMKIFLKLYQQMSGYFFFLHVNLYIEIGKYRLGYKYLKLRSRIVKLCLFLLFK